MGAAADDAAGAGTTGTGVDGIASTAGNTGVAAVGGGSAQAGLAGNTGSGMFSGGAAASGGGSANGNPGQGSAAANGGGSANGSSGQGSAANTACKGNSGNAVCDAQGVLFVCNPDESIGMQQACTSARHCMAGIKAKACAMCIPNEDYNCEGKALQVCAPDGLTFVHSMDCETEALCNKVAGACTDAKCTPGKTTCENNTLNKCNADGTDFEEQTPCESGTCDATGGDCNMCEPGAMSCIGDAVGTCDATGQTFMMTPCPSGNKCIGMGMCVACETANDCSAMTQGCKVGACQNNTCVAENASAGTTCTSSDGPGTCMNGACECTQRCTKECGEESCGRPCPNNCSGGEMCSSDKRCVECTSDLRNCSTTDPCKVPACTNSGQCTTQPGHDGASCDDSGGKCRSGSCVACVKDCSGKCGVDDGCGGTCSTQCQGGQMCNTLTHMCETRVTTSCIPGSACSGGLVCNDGGYCAGSCASGQSCARLGGYPTFCAPQGLCYIDCTESTNNSCPDGLTPVPVNILGTMTTDDDICLCQ